MYWLTKDSKMLSSLTRIERRSNMSLVTLYHNPQCSKSKRALALLEEKGIQFTIIEYLKNPLNADQIKTLSRKLGLPVRGITRTNEKEYQTQRLDEVSNTQLAEALAKMPILMQRPIVVKGDIALIGRPPEIILEILG